MGDETEEADYFFKIRKGKLVPGGNIVTGFTNLFVKNVPTPIGLPFAYFPSQQTKDSGFIIPNISDSNQRGYSIQNGGYYLPISDFFDLTILGDYYTNGSYGINISSTVGGTPYISVSMVPASNDIIALRDLYLTIADSDITVTTILDDISSSSRTSGVGQTPVSS